jgi:hypothetical protein
LEKSKYFFSYSRKDEDFVVNLAAKLKEAGANVWLDKKEIAPGARWDEAVAKSLGEAEGLVVALSSASVKSQNVMDEVSYAISEGKKIVPLLVETCPIPFRLARFQYIDFTTDYQQAFQQLLDTLNKNPNDTKQPSPVQTPPEKLPTARVVESTIKKKEANKEHTGKVTLTKSIGTVFILAAVLIALLKNCPNNVLLFIIYALIGIGIALLLAKSADRAKADVTIYNVGISLGGGVALPFILFFTNPIGRFKTDACAPVTSATIFVHGKKGRQDMILRQNGFVIMDVGEERKRASINENGQAYFQNLRIGDSVRLNIDFSEPYKALHPDSVYIIQQNSKIYLSVALEGIERVWGRVLYGDDPLEGVTVQIDSLSTTTKGDGNYNISVPEQMQRKEYQVWFIKKGYKSKSAPAFPQTGEPLNIIMEK